MAQREYEVTTASGIRLTVLMDEDAAKEQGLTPVRAAAPNTSAKVPQNKARKAPDKSRGVAGTSED